MGNRLPVVGRQRCTWGIAGRPVAGPAVLDNIADNTVGNIAAEIIHGRKTL